MDFILLNRDREMFRREVRIGCFILDPCQFTDLDCPNRVPSFHRVQAQWIADAPLRMKQLVKIAEALKKVQADTRRLESQIVKHDSRVKAATSQVLGMAL